MQESGGFGEGRCFGAGEGQSTGGQAAGDEDRTQIPGLLGLVPPFEAAQI